MSFKIDKHTPSHETPHREYVITVVLDNVTQPCTIADSDFLSLQVKDHINLCICFLSRLYFIAHGHQATNLIHSVTLVIMKFIQ